MDIIVAFITALAWVALLLSVPWSLLTLAGKMAYERDTMAQASDVIHRRTRSYPWMRRLVPAIVAICWLIAVYGGSHV